VDPFQSWNLKLAEQRPKVFIAYCALVVAFMVLILMAVMDKHFSWSLDGTWSVAMGLVGGLLAWWSVKRQGHFDSK